MKKQSLTLCKRYARALFETALDGGAGKLERVQGALSALAAFWLDTSSGEVSGMRELLSDPRIPSHVISDILRDMAAKLLPGEPFFEKFLVTLGENGRLSLLTSLHEVYAAMLREFKKSLALEITSAAVLSQDERKEISKKIEDAMPAQARALLSFEWLNDPQLVGGMVIKSGDALLDGSVRGSLARMQQIFGSGR